LVKFTVLGLSPHPCTDGMKFVVELDCYLRCPAYSPSFVHDGSTTNLCSLDLSKAFHKVNLRTLFIKLMKRNIPIQILRGL